MGDAQEYSESLKDKHDVVSNASLIDFLNNESTCVDEVKLFFEINRLASLNNSKFDNESDDWTIEELLKEAETLINQPIGVKDGKCTLSCESTPIEIRKGVVDQYDYLTTVKTLSHPDVSLLEIFYAFDTAFAMTCMNASVSLPELMI